MRKLRTLLTLCIVSLCLVQNVWAATYVAPDWSEYPITFEGNWTEYNTCFDSPSITTGETSMTAVITVDQDATLIFEYGNGGGTYNWDKGDLNVYVDNRLVQTINSIEYYDQKRYFVEMTSGEHVVKWSFVRNHSYGAYVRISDIGIMSSPTISVNLLEPGSLGTEALSQVDHIKKVRKLVVSGAMNDDDWSKIKMMTDLLSVDLSGTNITEIASEFFQKRAFPFLHFVRLPETLTTIGYRAFFESNIDDINFPSSLKNIGSGVFQYSKICEAMLPNTMNSIGGGAFSFCYHLRKANFPESVKVIQSNTFYACRQLNDLTLHEGLTEVRTWAMRDMPLPKRLPSTITTIGDGAFTGTWGNDSLFIPNSCSSIGAYAFQGCADVKYVELPVRCYQLASRDIFDIGSLTTVVIKSPTVLSASSSFVNSGRKSAITLKVPSYLVNSYKLDSYWYEFGSIEGFNTAEIQDWVISRPLTLNNSRFEGKPNITLKESGSLKLNGDAPMTINNLHSNRDWNSDTGWNTQILSNCDNITIEGKLTMNHCCRSQRWTFLCLPFDVKVSEVENIEGRKNAIRYYDGASRAQNGTGGNWKDFVEDDIIPAGTGFILQPSESSSTYFYAVDNEQKQFIVQNREFVKPLAANVSDNSANRGWNLVGNPWHCYYNIHKLNFTAPITTWNGSTYVAYSIIDDDYAIKPNEAFFVQCPDEVTEIAFPTDGRQLTSVIESQNASRRYGLAENGRQLIDIEVAGGDLKDKTRVVLNEESSLDYETLCDASKFFSMDGDVPQIYSVDEDGNEYAINERPLAEGVVKLRLSIQQAGIYTIMAPRADMKHAVLKDLLTNEVTDLTKDSYTVELEAGVYAERFELNFTGNAVTEMQHMKHDGMEENGQYYNLNGQAVTAPAKGVYIRNGKKMVVK